MEETHFCLQKIWEHGIVHILASAGTYQRLHRVSQNAKNYAKDDENRVDVNNVGTVHQSVPIYDIKLGKKTIVDLRFDPGVLTLSDVGSLQSFVLSVGPVAQPIITACGWQLGKNYDQKRKEQEKVRTAKSKIGLD